MPQLLQSPHRRRSQRARTFHTIYDRYGNRGFDELGTTTLPKSCGTSPNFTVCPAERKVVNPSVNSTPNDNRLAAADGYAFDASGNLKSDPQLRKFTYDSENKQTKVETVDSGGTVTGTIGEYVYDGDGKRVKKRRFGNGIVAEETVFVYDAGGKLVAEYSNQVASTNDANVGYLSSDHLGSPRINTDQNGAVISRHDYHPFGEEITASRMHVEYAGDTVRKQFTGYERDGESELDFAEARYHNSAHGRFTTVDPLSASASSADPQTFNRYAYAINNPLLFVDPTGESPTTHTDKNGIVLEVIEDGKTDILRHNDIDASSGKQVVIPTSSKHLVERVGATEYWDEFRGHDNETGAILPDTADKASINFGTTFQETINEKIKIASRMNLIDRARELKPGGRFDIKVRRPNEGRLLNGKYVTARSAGNYLAGYLGATGSLGTVYISEGTFLGLAGALHRNNFTNENAARIVAYGADYGSEIPFAVRQIQAGFRNGVAAMERNNLSFPRW